MNENKQSQTNPQQNRTKIDTDILNDTTLISNISDIRISTSSSGSKKYRNATLSSIERLENKKKTHIKLKNKLKEESQKIFEKAVNISYERIKTVHSNKLLTVPKTPFLRTEKRQNPILNELSPIKTTKGRFAKKDMVDRLNKSAANLLKKLDIMDDFKPPTKPPKNNRKFIPKNTVPKPFKLTQSKRQIKNLENNKVPVKKVEAKKINIKKILYKAPKLPVKYNKSTLVTKNYKNNPDEYINTLPRYKKKELYKPSKKNVIIPKKTIPKPFNLRSVEAHDKAVRLRKIEAKMKDEQERINKQITKSRARNQHTKSKNKPSFLDPIKNQKRTTDDDNIKTYRKKLEHKATKLPKFYKKSIRTKNDDKNEIFNINGNENNKESKRYNFKQ